MLWTDETRNKVKALLAVANGKRSARTMSFDDVEASALRALDSKLGFDWVTAGVAPDARALTTVCLAVVRDEMLTLGVNASHGDATPATAWNDLLAWNQHEPASNRSAVLAWAGRRRDDRVQVAFSSPAKTPPDDRGALLERVLQNPDDDGAREVFADFLTERDDPRGEFITLQLHAKPSGATPLGAAQTSKADRLLAANVTKWIPGLPSDRFVVHFERGFVAEVRCFNPDALEEVAAVVRVEPVTRLSFLSTRPFDMAVVAAWPEISRLRSISLHMLSGMALADGEATLEAMRAVRWPALEALYFRAQRIGDEGFNVLAQHAQHAFPKLTALGVDEDTVTAAGMGELLNSKWASRLERLSLSENLLGPNGAEVIAQSRRLSRLTQLSLAGNGLGNDGARALADAGGLRSLLSLDLRRNRITPAGLNALLESHHLRHLEQLELTGNPLGRAGWKEVRERFGE
ncbi:MAG: TIGR02996 domain-containing protein [Archangium sp.]|nr:TIGR02996 domain-containing protein [Archangium sp.]